jgi:chromosome segregation ATPase
VTLSRPPSPGPAASAGAAARDAQAEASWQQRALNAEQALKAAHAEIRAQRARIGELIGQLRDARDDHDAGAAERLGTENTTLRQRVRDLTAASRTLDERLQAARSNNRFLDKRIAGLEAQLLNEIPAT